MTARLETIKAELVLYAQKASALGLIPNTQGNLSARDPETGLIAITPSNFPYEIMTVEDIVTVDEQGQVVAGRHKPSYETPVHCTVYRERPAVHGIVHTEPVYTTSFGVVGRPIDLVVVNLPLAVGGEVPVMPFMHTGSAEFGYRMLEVMGDRRAVIWANHGLLTVGETLEAAFRCTVVVEHAAQVYFLALQLSKPNLLSLQDLEGLVG